MMDFLVVGGTGTLGTEFIRQNYGLANITVISRDELKQKQLKSRFPKIRTVLCDIRDKSAVDTLFLKNDFDHVYHFAAIKHVDVCEDQPLEALKTNVQGSRNLVEAALQSTYTDRFIFSSTDKAVLPINIYGMTKFIAERDLRSMVADQRKLKLMIFRWGNIMGSRGSVIPKFIETLQREKRVYITDPRMTRFWLKIEDAVSFLNQKVAAHHEIDTVRGFIGEFQPEIKAAPVLDVASAIASILGIKDWRYETVGIGQGEKLHEFMTPFVSSLTCPRYSFDQLVIELEPFVRSIVGINP